MKQKKFNLDFNRSTTPHALYSKENIKRNAHIIIKRSYSYKVPKRRERGLSCIANRS